MERRALMLSLLLASMLTLTFNVQLVRAESGTWTVDDDGPADFHTIQEAINAASLGDTIYVYNGTYYEHVTVNKTVSLVGENKHSTIIDGNGTGTVIYVAANNVNINGFTIQKSGPWALDGGIDIDHSIGNSISNNIITNNQWGIMVRYSSHNTLTDNNFSNNRYNFDVRGYDFPHYNNYVDTSNTVDGKSIYYLIGASNAVYNAQSNAGTIYLINCNNITIKDVTLTKNGKGVFLWNTTNSKIENVTASNNHYGIWFHYSNNNTIAGSNVTNNGFGMKLRYSSNNILSGNNISNNYRFGILLYESDSNIVSGNNISNNGWGIMLLWSRDNAIFHNTSSLTMDKCSFSDRIAISAKMVILPAGTIGVTILMLIGLVVLARTNLVAMGMRSSTRYRFEQCR